jgi:hypothetical protein
MDDIRNREILRVVLLQTLSRFPEGAAIHRVYEEIDKNFHFPAEWYRELPAGTGYSDLKAKGYADWRSIPQEKLVELVRTEPQWQNVIRWARNDLREIGHLDENAPRGIWKLTARGFQAARSNAAASLSPEEKRIATPQPKQTVSPQTKTVVKSGATDRGYRETLEEKLHILTSSMPTADLEILVDIARVVRQRSLER